MSDLARERAIELEDENAALRSRIVTQSNEIKHLREQLEEWEIKWQRVQMARVVAEARLDAMGNKK